MADKKPLEGMAKDDSIGLLRQIFRLLKPLGNVVGGGSNRLQVDMTTIGGVIPASAAIGSVGTVTTVTSVTSVVSVTSVAGLNNIGGVTAFDQMKSQNRVGYAVGPRANLSF